MNKTLTALAILLCVGCSGPGTVTAQENMDNVPLTLSGCVVAGVAKDSYMLTNVVIDSATSVPTNAFYRFDSTKGLRDQVGNRVEVTGLADFADVDKGKVRVKTDDEKTTTAVSSERRTVKVDKNIWAGSMGALDIKDMSANVATYKFKVTGVKRLQGNCEGATAAQ